LWSDEDTAAGHWRRYSLTAIGRALQQAGFTVDFASYFFGFLPLPILLARVAPYRFGLSKTSRRDSAESDHNPGGALVRKMLNTLTRRELTQLASLEPIKFGGSCLVAARRSSNLDTFG
jgi:hypothetical protein